MLADSVLIEHRDGEWIATFRKRTGQHVEDVWHKVFHSFEAASRGIVLEVLPPKSRGRR